MEEGKLVYLKLSEMHPFHTFRPHPFKVRDDAKMQETVASIKANEMCIRDREITEEKIYILMDMHHILYDEKSLDIIFSEIWKLYRGETLEAVSYTHLDVYKRQFPNPA